MKALAIDTSNHYLSLALSCHSQTWEYHEEVGQRHTELILPQIQHLLNEADLSIRELDTIIYAQGPGTFTGLRVGASIAKGLALPFDIPLIAIPTLDAIAAQFNESSIWVAIDARMKQVYWRHYITQSNQLAPQGDIQVGFPNTIPAVNDKAIGVGNGFAVYQEHFPKNFLAALARIEPEAKPRGSAYLALAKSNVYPKISAEKADLLYIRNHVALTLEEQKKCRR